MHLATWQPDLAWANIQVSSSAVFHSSLSPSVNYLQELAGLGFCEKGVLVE